MVTKNHCPPKGEAQRVNGLPKLLAECQGKNEDVFLFLMWRRFTSSLKSELVNHVAAVACGQSTPDDICRRLVLECDASGCCCPLT
jgi:hypothetical protein